MEYRVNFFTTTLVATVVSAIVGMYLWQSVYDSSQNFAVGTMTVTDMLIYIACATLCHNLTKPTKFERAASEEIRNGELSKYLLKPISHIGYALSAGFAERFVAAQLMMLFALLVGLPLVYMYNVTLSPVGMLCALPVLICGMLIQSLIGLSLSYLAFWVDEVWTFHIIKDISFWLLGGLSLPMTALPLVWQTVADWLPFQYLAYIPAAMMTGKIAAIASVVYIVKAVAWVGVLVAVTVWVWKRGVERLGAYGG